MTLLNCFGVSALQRRSQRIAHQHLWNTFRFRRPEGEAALERYLTGLLTALPNKNCDTMAEAVPGTSEQRLQEFLTNMQWDEHDLNRQRVEKMIAEATVGHGVLLFDDTGF